MADNDEGSAEGRDDKWAVSHSKGARGGSSGDWMTPRSVADEVSAIASALGLPALFGLDVAANPGSALAPDWYGPAHFDARRRDALAPGVSWDPPRGTLAWLNPPYASTAAFAAKAAEYRSEAPLFVLTFARTDTRWFHDHVLPHATGIWFRKGRIRFIDPTTGKAAATAMAPAPSMLAMFGPRRPLAAAAAVGRWYALAPPRAP